MSDSLSRSETVRATVDPLRRGLRLLGWAVLLLGLPAALLGILAAPNEYEATLGINALDCVGPLAVMLIAGPAFLLYAGGLIVTVRRWRKPANLAAAIVCLLLCAGLAGNMSRAASEEGAQRAACAAR